MDVPVPEVYMQVTQADDGSEEYGVVDGQQRLRTILQFVGLEKAEDQEGKEDENNFALDVLPDASIHKGKTFANVTGESRKLFFQYEIAVRFLFTDKTTEIEDVFKRLNKFMMPLKAQELRNATYHSAFSKLSEELADDEYWVLNRIVRPAAIRRMADIEMMSDLLIGLLHGPQGGSAKIIDQYYDQYEQFEDEFPDQARIALLFSRIRQTIKRLFPHIADTRWGNRADYYSLFVALGGLLKNRKNLPSRSILGVRRSLINFAREVDERIEDPTAKTSRGPRIYARAIEKGSNDKARRADRHEALTTLMQDVLTP